MAGAHAKFTGEPGVCLATPGPGAIHLLNGLYDAGMDHQPVCRMTCAFGLCCAPNQVEKRSAFIASQKQRAVSATPTVTIPQRFGPA